jgi:hypothetical protein
MDWHVIEVLTFTMVVVSSTNYSVYCIRHGFRIICFSGILSMVLWSILLVIYPGWCVLSVLILVILLNLIIKDRVVNE